MHTALWAGLIDLAEFIVIAGIVAIVMNARR